MKLKVTVPFLIADHTIYKIPIKVCKTSAWIHIIGSQPSGIYQHVKDFNDSSCEDNDELLVSTYPLYFPNNKQNYILLDKNEIINGVFQGMNINMLFQLAIPYKAFLPKEIHLNESERQTFDRQIRCYGEQLQMVLESLHIGVVGCGGTGSSVLEQLCRMGVSEVTILDDDILSSSNLTRVYGATKMDVHDSANKVDVLRKHLLTINPHLIIHSYNTKLFFEESVDILKQCDVIFGCTDDYIGRVLLDRLCRYYLIPVFLCGVLIKNTNQAIEEIYGRVTLLTPHSPCIWCRNNLHPDDLQKEVIQFIADHHQTLGNYFFQPMEIEPSVIPYTTTVSSMVLSLFLEFINGEVIPYDDYLFLLKSLKIIPFPKATCSCNLNTQLGTNDVTPRLNIIWPKKEVEP